MNYPLIATIAFAFLWVVAKWLEDWDTNWSRMFAIGFITSVACFGVVSCSESESWTAAQAAQAARDANDAQPGLHKEVDGCKIYKFKFNDHWHFFTRCPDSSTTTDTARTVRSGETSRTEHSSIEVKR